MGECLDSPRIDTPDVGESGMEIAGGSPPADIDICVVPDVLPTVISVKTVVSDKSMEIDTPDAVVSRLEVTSGSPPAEIDISGGPDVLQTVVSVTTGMSDWRTEINTSGGGEIADAYPLVVVESDTAQVSGLQMAKSDTARVSVLPVAGCKFPAVSLGKVALDVVGLGVGPPCLRVDSEETLLTLTDERAQSARAALGISPVDSS